MRARVGLGLLLAAVATCCLAALGIDAARADAAQVTVVAPGGAQQTLSLDALAGGEDVVGRAYTLRGTSGESAQTVTGFSLAAILDAAGADPYGFSYLEAQRPAGGAVLLSRHQALDPGAFADGPPVVYATAAGTGFLRPSAGADDLNSSDSFEAPQGVTIVLRKGSPLRVRATASPLRTQPGREVAFSAIVERSGSGEQLTFSWYFDDGHSASGPSVRHRFAKRGSYDVVVGVTTPSDSAGASAVVTIQVGPPIDGPDRRGGGTDEDAGAPDHGAASGAPGATASGSGAAAGPTAMRSLSCPDAGGRCDRDEGDKRRLPTPSRPAGERVSGLLLTSAKKSPPERPDTISAARTGKLSTDGNGLGLSGTALGVLATLALFAAGALLEARGSLVTLFVTKEPQL